VRQARGDLGACAAEIVYAQTAVDDTAHIIVGAERDADWSLPLGGRLEGAVEHAGAPSRRGLGGAVLIATG